MSRALNTNIRAARLGDAPRLVELLQQLGYVVALSHVERSIAATGNDYGILVAIDEDISVLGMLEVRLSVAGVTTAERGGFISAVVVDGADRSRGAGEALVRAAEEWARERGCAILELRTNVVRARAHAFYERLGYARKKSQHLYARVL